MRNRLHKTKQTVALGELCRQAGLECPLDDAAQKRVRVEFDPSLDERAVRNLPERSYTVRTKNALEILEILAYEAHQWEAWEVMRHQRRRQGGLLLT